MKATNIVVVAVIAVAVGVLVMASGDMSTYATFEDAAKTTNKVKVVGQLAKDKEMYYNPEKDPNYFSFYVKDEDGVEKKVILKASKPQDFEKSESIVLTGSMVGDEFVATDMLMKCPSKYKDEEIRIKSRT
ncbi:MAG: cytochrome c maturation protein CcmE [Saprospiraceae bacterium]